MLCAASLTDMEYLAFSNVHLGMTAVCPGFNNFLITRMIDDQAVARVTMPGLVSPGVNYMSSGGWMLFNASGKASWSLREGSCRHTLQSLDKLRRNALVRINVRETLTFTFKALLSDFCKCMLLYCKVLNMYEFFFSIEVPYNE